MTSTDAKSSKICNVFGGIDVARFVSAHIRQVFRGAIEDVELIREYVSLAAANEGIVGGLSSLKALNNSLEWKAQGLKEGNTTVAAGLGYSDDRMDRSLDRYVSLREEPLVGDKETDMMIADTLSNLLPWILDRRSEEKKWWTPHQNGRSEGAEKEAILFGGLYTAAWIGTHGNAWLYYPPLVLFGDGRPNTLGDLIGGDFEALELPYIKPNLPENNPTRRAFLTEPYPDVAHPGLSLITALAPVYLTGNFGNVTYNETYFASAGVDIAVESTSSLLDTLLDTMTASSFAVVADMSFHVVVISQTVVERLYPTLTGFEEARVTYSYADGSIIEDRRNQTYRVSDTLHQDLTQLENANWQELLRTVKLASRGERGFALLNLTLTGEVHAREFYVMYERWADVADWVLLAFAPVDDVEHAVDVRLDSWSEVDYTSVTLRGEWGLELFGEAVMTNHGALDVEVATKSIPSGFQIADFEKAILLSGSSMPIQFTVDTSKLSFGVSSFLVTFTITDDGYPDCFYDSDISLAVTVTVLPKDCARLTGDPLRVSDENGVCVCTQTSVEIGGSCAGQSVLFPSILIPLLLLGAFLVHLYIKRKRQQADSIWLINSADLLYDETPEILGRGTFGLVVRAEYRGTQVAVKRVIPPLSQTKDGSRESVDQNRLGSTQRLHASARFGSMLSRHSSEILRAHSGVHFEFSRSRRLDHASATSAGVADGNHVKGNHTLSSAESLNDPSTRMTRVTSKQYAKLKADFIKEMRLLSKLRHPCITTVMGAVLSSGQEPLLVMELMDHGSLFDLLHNDSMVVEGDIVLQILRDVAQGLRFLHAATPQVVHGDLKAQNILVDSKFRAKVADFGLSQKRDVGAAGTPFWMAPELLNGTSTNTAASDVYSFGIILYEVYSRRIPYEGEDFEDTIEKIRDPYISKRPPVPESMPPEIVTLMNACTNAHPDIRPPFRVIDEKLKAFDVKTVEPSQLYFSLQKKKGWDTTLTASENLLLDIFPKHVAEALSQGQKVEPQHFDCVTIFFSDIVRHLLRTESTEGL